MKKLNEKNGMRAAGYDSPRLDVFGINVRRMLCSSVFGGTENMRMDGSLNPEEDGGIEHMGVDVIDF